jgi:hypothetical protein
MHSCRRRALKGRFLKTALAAALLVAAVVLVAACGGDEGGGAAPSPEPAETPAGSTPLASPVVDPNVPLVEYHSAEKGYSLSYPEGWTVDAAPGTVTDLFSWTIDSRHLALLQVTCNRELLTPDQLMLADGGVASDFGGQLNPEAAVPVQVEGVEGKRNMYSLTVSGLMVEHVVAYLVHGSCGWRIGLNSYGSGSLQPYLPLFDRILASVSFD